MPSFRREHGRQVSSRKFGNNRQARRRHDKQVGARLFITGVIAACLVVITAMGVHLLKRPAASRSTSWSGTMSPYAVDPGPDPIIHNPSAVVERFLSATTTSDLEALAREDDNSLEILSEEASRMLTWLEGHREWVPMHEAKANGLLFSVFAVGHISERSRPIYVVQTDHGPQVDIGAFLGWCSEPWDNLVKGRATNASIIRANVSRVAYYNYRFSDDKVFQSYRLDSHDAGPSIYGYVVRGTTTAVLLEKLIPAGSPFPLVLSLDEGERGSTTRQFKISRIVAAGWAMGPELLEDHLPQLVDDPSLLAPVSVRPAILNE